MYIGEQHGPAKIPEPPMSQPIKSPGGEKGLDGIDFDSIVSASNMVKQDEMEKEKLAMGGGDIRIGETKDDKEFREQLEKITGKKQEKAKNTMTRDDYLNLLVTQLKYQDPSKPMDNQEMAAQMAQFNTVEQLVGVNKTLEKMNQQQIEAKQDKLAQYLGKHIEVQGNQLKMDGQRDLSVARINLSRDASTVNIEVKDAQLKVVRILNLGELKQGSHNVEWDGLNVKGEKCAPGNYTFHVNASSVEGVPVSVESSFLARVEGVSDILKGGKLETSSGAVDPSKIIAVRNIEKNDVVKPTVPAVSAPLIDKTAAQQNADQKNPVKQVAEQKATDSQAPVQQASVQQAPAKQDTAQPQAPVKQVAAQQAPTQPTLKTISSNESKGDLKHVN
jgi:flagellar basal-body rod modification protein FlgD